MSETNKVYWQAHRGGGAHEAPDNTMGANRYAWGLGGIPEADIRSTKDGVIICLHDRTLARTTNAPDEIKDVPVSELTFEEIRRWDAGVKFSESFAGEKVPSLEEMFAEMKGNPDRLAYLDLKEVDLRALGELIDRYGVNGQVIFTHKIQDNCRSMKQIARGVRTMQWIGGNPEQIRGTYLQLVENGFDGLDQIQFHLHSDPSGGDWPYALKAEFLREALAVTKEAGVDFEVLPFAFDEDSIRMLLDIGIRWYATDEPARFLECVKKWQEANR